MAHILIALTSHSELGDTGKQTGFHYEEFTTPYYALLDAGHTVDIASTQGGQPPYDPSSLPDDENARAASVTRFLNDAEARKQLSESFAFHEINRDRYDGIYLPGGHGTMWDLPDSSALADIVGMMHDNGKIIAAVCHGAAGLIGARNPKDNSAIVEGKRVNCFTNDEEREAGLDEVVPFLLETKLKELGGIFEFSGPFKSHVVRDGNVITGQNPASLGGLCQQLLKALNEQTTKQAA